MLIDHQPTEKVQRKAAAADANNKKIFSQTQYGRTRILPLPAKVIAGVVAIAAVPFLLVYRLFKSRKKADTP